MGNLPHNVRCLEEPFNTCRSNGNIQNNPAYLHVFVPWGEGEADVTQGRALPAVGGWGLGWGSGAGSAGLLQLLLLDIKQALPSSCLLCCGQTQHPSMLSLINIPRASKPSAFFQLSPPPRTVGSSSSKCQTLAVPPLFLSLLGSLGCKASSKGYSCKEGSDKC